MKRLWLIAALVSAIACANLTAKLPHLPDGSLDVKTLIDWASDGVEADCLFGPESNFCIFGRDAIADARVAMDRNPTAIRAAVKHSLEDSMKTWPSITGWFTWLTEIL